MKNKIYTGNIYVNCVEAFAETSPNAFNIFNARYWKAQLDYTASIKSLALIYGIVFGFIVFTVFITFGYLNYEIIFNYTPIFLRWIYG